MTTDFAGEVARLRTLLAKLGYRIERITPQGVSRRHENWKIELEDGTARLLRICRTPDASSLEREQAALNRLQLVEIPVVSSYQRVDEHFGKPAAITSWIEGSGGIGVMDAHAEALPSMCRMMGELRAELEEHTVGTFAVDASQGRFRAARPNWAAEYATLVYDWHESAVRSGVSLGPVGAELLDRIAQASPVLAQVKQACLVHGDLRPANFVLQVEKSPEKAVAPNLTLLGVVDWEFARMGDPLLAWALPLELPVDALAHVIDGYGRERVEAWLTDPGALTRLQTYAMGRVFQYLADVVRHQLADDVHWGHGLTHVARLCQERLRPDFVKDKLTEALALEPLPEVVAMPVWEVPERAVLWRALTQLSFRPSLTPAQAHAWMAAVACGLRHATHADEGWAREGETHLEQLPRWSPRGFEPITDRRGWIVGLERYVASTRSDAALAALALGFQALATVGGEAGPNAWMTSDHLLRGLQTLVESIAQQPTTNDPRDTLRDAALGFAAEVQLAALLRRPIDQRRQAERMASLREAWEDLTVFQGHTPVEGAPWDPTTWSVPVLLVAGPALQGLPMTLGELVHGVVA